MKLYLAVSDANNYDSSIDPWELAAMSKFFNSVEDWFNYSKRIMKDKSLKIYHYLYELDLQEKRFTSYYQIKIIRDQMTARILDVPDYYEYTILLGSKNI